LVMRRRDFITLLGGAGAWPLSARAQQPAMPVIGFLASGSRAPYQPQVAAFLQGLKDTGYTAGSNVGIEYRWAEGQYERLPELASELVRRHVSVIAAMGGVTSVAAAKGATTTIPIVFQVGVDPTASGLVPSLNRPGGNVTGFTMLSREVGPKRVEVLHQMIPTATTLALVVNPTSPLAEAVSKELVAAAGMLGVRMQVLNASTDSELDAAFATAAQLRAGGLAIEIDPFFTSRMEQLAAMALRRAVPAIYQFREFAAAGGLMSYGASIADQYRQVGIYVGRVLKGEKPGDLPVQQATKVELIVNLKTAKALGIDVPPALLIRADELIE
jgi:putative tryptophan/tyrosine transport system substrate-binding protein